MSWFCKHKWEVLSKDTLPSRLAVMQRLGRHPRSYTSFDANEVQITIVTCKSCGKIKRYKTVTGG